METGLRAPQSLATVARMFSPINTLCPCSANSTQECDVLVLDRHELGNFLQHRRPHLCRNIENRAGLLEYLEGLREGCVGRFNVAVSLVHGESGHDVLSIVVSTRQGFSRLVASQAIHEAQPPWDGFTVLIIHLRPRASRKRGARASGCCTCPFQGSFFLQRQSATLVYPTIQSENTN